MASPISPLTGPDTPAFERAARVAIARMPDNLRQQLTDVVFRIAEFATEEQLASVDIECRWDLSGLYEGIPLTEQSQWQSGDMPPIITLFRQPLLLEMRETGVSLEELVHHVVIHEAGHHFGFSDDDMHWLEDSAED
jgi:predicted Zn-dependent protease with MMP-like domain